MKEGARAVAWIAFSSFVIALAAGASDSIQFGIFNLLVISLIARAGIWIKEAM
jgi:hypothetical protein